MKFADLILFQICCGLKKNTSFGPSTNQNIMPIGVEVLSQSLFPERTHTEFSANQNKGDIMSSPVYCCLLVYTQNELIFPLSYWESIDQQKASWSIFIVWRILSLNKQTNWAFRGELLRKMVLAHIATIPSLLLPEMEKESFFFFCAFTIYDSDCWDTPFLKEPMYRENIVHNFSKMYLKKNKKIEENARQWKVATLL